MGSIIGALWPVFDQKQAEHQTVSVDKLHVNNLQASMELDDDLVLNGYMLSNHYIPEEILQLILSYVPAKDLLKCRLVCDTWNKLIQSDSVWVLKLKRERRQKPKKVPWFVYYAAMGLNFFDTNLIQNGNGENDFKSWHITANGGDGWRIENPPCGCDPLPLDTEEFNGHTSCFATSYYSCTKEQVIDISNPMLQLILNEYRPHIYVSEWVCGRFDCSCEYAMKLNYVTTKNVKHENVLATDKLEQWCAPKWNKLSAISKNYPKNINKIVFEHCGKDGLFWKGHYGSKMAGAAVKVLFDTIKEKDCTI